MLSKSCLPSNIVSSGSERSTCSLKVNLICLDKMYIPLNVFYSLSLFHIGHIGTFTTTGFLEFSNF